jgi:hypothetical protein
MQSSSVIEFRLDPNENITTHDFYNELDWIRLTKPITVRRGENYLIRIDKFFPNDSFNVNLYYTADPTNNPKQHPVVLHNPPPPTSPVGPYTINLPIITNGSLDPVLGNGDLEYQWDTSSVQLGNYYICAEVFDNFNLAIFCSEASVTIIP